MAVESEIRTLEWVVGALEAAGERVATERAVGRGARIWAGAVVDSRADCSGRLFFALAGENTDGHRYAKDAFNAGCVAVIASDAATADSLSVDGIPCLLVTDTRRALQELARAYRAKLDVRVVAVTGSAGKTTTKEYTRQIVRTRYRVYSSPGNFNSLIGVPLAILEAEPDNDYLVCEVGANQVGEIAFLGGLLRPDVAVITNIGDAHIGMFGSIENIVREKSELLSAVGAQGDVVLPRDDRFYDRLAAGTDARVWSFGHSRKADFVLSDVASSAEGLSFTINGERFALNAVGEYNALNACAAVAVGDLCGIASDAIRKALHRIHPMPGRGRVDRAGGVTLIDESYNASPASMKKSLEMLSSIDAPRRIAVLGDMRELGDFTNAKHREVGEVLARSRVDECYWYGEAGARVAEGFESSGGTAPFRRADSIDDLVETAVGDARDGDVILVKASRALNLDLFVTRFIERMADR